MEISKKSWHARYYKWVNLTDDLPDGLCNYFWILLLGIIFLPFMLFCWIPLWIVWKIAKPTNWKLFAGKGEKVLPLIYYYQLTNRFGYMGIGLVFWSAISFAFWVVILIIELIDLIHHHQAVFADVAFGSIIGLALILIVYFMLRKKKKPDTVSFFKMSGEAISGWYNKYCPQIKWKD